MAPILRRFAGFAVSACFEGVAETQVLVCLLCEQSCIISACMGLGLRVKGTEIYASVHANYIPKPRTLNPKP